MNGWLTLDVISVIRSVAPFGALNGLTRSCRYLAAMPPDPADWIKWETVEHRHGYWIPVASIPTLPNGLIHGAVSIIHRLLDTYTVGIRYHLGRPTDWVLWQDNTLTTGRCGSHMAISAHYDEVVIRTFGEEGCVSSLSALRRDSAYSVFMTWKYTSCSHTAVISDTPTAPAERTPSSAWDYAANVIAWCEKYRAELRISLMPYPTGDAPDILKTKTSGSFGSIVSDIIQRGLPALAARPLVRWE